MMREGKPRSAAAYLAAGFILACYLAQTANCYRLKKTERRRVVVADSAEAMGVREGTIVFGGGLEKESALGSQVVNVTGKASVEDKTAYQADSAGWSRGQAQDFHSSDVSWKRMAPSLQCGGDQMRFRAVGPGASQFAVEQGNAPPMPLSQVPSTCGYSMQRNSLALVMLVPYDGCNMVQEGGSYMLPMRWQGIPVSLWCPKPAAPAAPSAVPQTPKDPPSNPKVPHDGKNPEVSNPEIPRPFFSPYMAYQYPSGVVPQPAATEKPEMPKFQQYYFPPPYAYLSPPLTATPTTEAKLITAKPAAKVPPQVFQYPPYQHIYPFPWPLPTTAVTTTTQATTTTPTHNTMLPQVPIMPQMPQFPKGPMNPQVPMLPQMPQFPHGHMLPQMPQLPHGHMLPQFPHGHMLPQLPHGHMLPQFPHGHMFPQGPMNPQMPMLPQMPQFPHGHMLPPFGHFLPHYHSIPLPQVVPYNPTSKPEVTTTAAPTTTTTEKTEPKLSQAMLYQPPVNLPYPLLPYHFLYPPPGVNKMV